jgi:hypothetical protein
MINIEMEVHGTEGVPACPPCQHEPLFRRGQAGTPVVPALRRVVFSNTMTVL